MTTKDTSPKITFNLVSVLAIIVLIILVGMAANSLGKHNENKKTEEAQIETEIAGAQAITYEGVDGQTALDLLRKNSEIKTEDSSLGAFVISINGTDNTNERYWMFYVDGKLAPIAADQYKTKSGEKIEWRYEDINSLPLP